MFWEFWISKTSKLLGSNSLKPGWFSFHTPPASDCWYCPESSFPTAALPHGGSASRRSCPQAHVNSLSCLGVIQLDMQGAEEQVMDFLTPVGRIPCYSSTHGLQNPCNGQQKDFGRPPATWEVWLGKWSVTRGHLVRQMSMNNSKGRRQSLWFLAC